MIRFRIAAVLLLTFGALPAHAFDIGFDWKGLNSCTSGNPGTVKSPAFTPEGRA